MSKMQTLSLVHDESLQMVHFHFARRLHAKLFWERDPIIKFLLLKCLRVDSEAL